MVKYFLPSFYEDCIFKITQNKLRRKYLFLPYEKVNKNKYRKSSHNAPGNKLVC